MKNTDKRRKVLVDFEWHIIAKEFTLDKEKAGHEIIEFGAVMLDEENNEIQSFKRYVKPRFVTEVSKKIQKLTGITTEMLSDADDFAIVLNEFLTWCSAGGDHYDIYSWSDSDLLQIKYEMELKNIEVTDAAQYMLDHWIDLQQEYGTDLGFDKQVSLANALFTAGLDPVGRAHDALDDARNTAVLYCFLTNPENQNTTIKTIHDALHGDNHGTTMGELIDWSALMASVG